MELQPKVGILPLLLVMVFKKLQPKVVFFIHFWLQFQKRSLYLHRKIYFKVLCAK